MRFVCAALVALFFMFQAVLGATTTITFSVIPPNGGHLQYQQKPIYDTVVATVGGVAATGNVVVYVDGSQTSSGNCNLNSNGACNVTDIVTVLSVGIHTAKAVYAGDANYPAANSTVQSFQVYAVTVLTLTSTPAGNIAPGTSVVFTVTTSNTGSLTGPTGAINLIDVSHGNAVLGTCDITGVTSCQITYAGFLAGTNYTINAVYPGDSTYDSATAPSVFFAVSGTAVTTSTTSGSSTTATISGNGTTVTTGTTGTTGSTAGNTSTLTSATSTSATTTSAATTSITAATSTITAATTTIATATVATATTTANLATTTAATSSSIPASATAASTTTTAAGTTTTAAGTTTVAGTTATHASTSTVATATTATHATTTASTSTAAAATGNHSTTTTTTTTNNAVFLSASIPLLVLAIAAVVA